MEEQEPVDKCVRLILVKSDDPEEYIWIVINGTVLHHLHVKRSENFGLILKRYLETTGNPSAKLKYNEKDLRDDETPASLNMRGSAVIGKWKF